MDLSQKSRVLASHVHRDKMGTMVVVRWYFPHTLLHMATIIKYCDVCQHMNTYQLQKGHEPLHPILILIKVSSQIENDLLDSVKETYGCRYIVTAVDYASSFLRQRH